MYVVALVHFATLLLHCSYAVAVTETLVWWLNKKSLLAFLCQCV